MSRQFVNTACSIFQSLSKIFAKRAEKKNELCVARFYTLQKSFFKPFWTLLINNLYVHVLYQLNRSDSKFRCTVLDQHTCNSWWAHLDDFFGKYIYNIRNNCMSFHCWSLSIILPHSRNRTSSSGRSDCHAHLTRSKRNSVWLPSPPLIRNKYQDEVNLPGMHFWLHFCQKFKE